jgi:hypothetical protein
MQKLTNLGTFFNRLPPHLEYLGTDTVLNENQINSLPLSIRKLEALSLCDMKDAEIKALSRLVNLTSISGFVPFSLNEGLASYLPRRLQYASTCIRLSELPSMPSSITDLTLLEFPPDAPDPFYSQYLSLSPAASFTAGIEKMEENAVWPFPSLTYLKLHQLPPKFAKRLPTGLEKLLVWHDEGITLEMAQQLSNKKKLKFLSAGLLHSENCIAALPRTLTHLEGKGMVSVTLPDRYLVIKSDFSSFDLPRSLTHLNLGTIHVNSGTWFNGLPRTLNHLVVGVVGAQETDFGIVDFPPFLTVLELVVHTGPNQGILPLLYSIPKGIKNLNIPKIGQNDTALTNETFGSWIQAYPSLRRLILPQSRGISEMCLHMLPKRLKHLEFHDDSQSGIPSWAPGYSTTLGFPYKQYKY